MEKYIISCCSTADLTREYFEKIGVRYICFHYELDGVSYEDDLGQSMPLDLFYERMAGGAQTKTSSITAFEFYTYFRSFLDKGYDILHICLSSGISNTCRSANTAKKMLEDEYSNRKIYIVDSLAASSGYGLLADRMAGLRDAGMTVDELYAWAENNKKKLQHWFFSTDLTFYIRGGRISKTAGAIGSMFEICPLLTVDAEGKLVLMNRIRTKKKVLQAAADKMLELADDGAAYSGKCFICHSACPEDAAILAQMAEERFPKLQGKAEIFQIGTTIGSHTGPGTVSVFFWGKERIE